MFTTIFMFRTGNGNWYMSALHVPVTISSAEHIVVDRMNDVFKEKNFKRLMHTQFCRDLIPVWFVPLTILLMSKTITPAAC